MNNIFLVKWQNVVTENGNLNTGVYIVNILNTKDMILSMYISLNMQH